MTHFGKLARYKPSHAHSRLVTRTWTWFEAVPDHPETSQEQHRQRGKSRFKASVTYWNRKRALDARDTTGPSPLPSLPTLSCWITWEFMAWRDDDCGTQHSSPLPNIIRSWHNPWSMQEDEDTELSQQGSRGPKVYHSKSTCPTSNI